MGSYFSCSRWCGLDKTNVSGSNMECLSQCLVSTPSEEMAMDRKYDRFEQRFATLEMRINTTEEANQRLYNKWNTIDDRFQQLEQLYQGDVKALMIRFRAIEQRMDTMTFDHCERLDDDIIVIEES